MFFYRICFTKVFMIIHDIHVTVCVRACVYVGVGVLVCVCVRACVCALMNWGDRGKLSQWV